MAQSGLFAYTPADTALQRLDPRIKLPALIMLQAIAFTLTPWALALLAGFTAAGYRVARVPVIATLRRMLPLGVLLAVIVLISAGGSALYALRVATAVMLANLFTAVTPAGEICAVLTTALRPLTPRFAAQLALAAALTLRFIEVLFSEIGEAKAAVLARGCDRPVQRTAAIAGSVLHRLPRRSDEITAALTARGYTGAPFTAPLRRLRAGDLVACAGLLALAAALLALSAATGA